MSQSDLLIVKYLLPEGISEEKPFGVIEGKEGVSEFLNVLGLKISSSCSEYGVNIPDALTAINILASLRNYGRSYDLKSFHFEYVENPKCLEFCRDLRVTPPSDDAKCSSCRMDNVEILSSHCGHSACRDCWTQTVKRDLINKKSPLPRCIGHTLGCRNYVKEGFSGQISQQLVSDIRTIQVSQFLESSSTLECCDRIYFNPVSYTSREKLIPVICGVCSRRKCFGCRGRNFYHLPLPCDLLKFFETMVCRRFAVGSFADSEETSAIICPICPSRGFSVPSVFDCGYYSVTACCYQCGANFCTSCRHVFHDEKQISHHECSKLTRGDENEGEETKTTKKKKKTSKKKRKDKQIRGFDEDDELDGKINMTVAAPDRTKVNKFTKLKDLQTCSLISSERRDIVDIFIKYSYYIGLAHADWRRFSFRKNEYRGIKERIKLRYMMLKFIAYVHLLKFCVLHSHQYSTSSNATLERFFNLGKCRSYFRGIFELNIQSFEESVIMSYKNLRHLSVPKFRSLYDQIYKLLGTISFLPVFGEFVVPGKIPSPHFLFSESSFDDRNNNPFFVLFQIIEKFTPSSSTARVYSGKNHIERFLEYINLEYRERIRKEREGKNAQQQFGRQFTSSYYYDDRVRMKQVQESSLKRYEESYKSQLQKALENSMVENYSPTPTSTSASPSKKIENVFEEFEQQQQQQQQKAQPNDNFVNVSHIKENTFDSEVRELKEKLENVRDTRRQLFPSSSSEVEEKQPKEGEEEEDKEEEENWEDEDLQQAIRLSLQINKK